MMLMAFFGQALGVASFPFMSKLAAQGRMEELNQLLTGALRYLALMIPISVLVWVLRTEIIRVLFERMRFSPHDTDMTALALSGLLVGATAFTAQTVVNRGFYALQNTWLPAIVSTITAIISLPVYWIGIKMLGVPGLGLAISWPLSFRCWSSMVSESHQWELNRSVNLSVLCKNVDIIYPLGRFVVVHPNGGCEVVKPGYLSDCRCPHFVGWRCLRYVNGLAGLVF